MSALTILRPITRIPLSPTCLTTATGLYSGNLTLKRDFMCTPTQQSSASSSNIPHAPRPPSSKKTNKPQTQMQKKVLKFLDSTKRATRFTFSSTLVLAAIAVSGVSMYFLFNELFSPSGETSTFNRVVSMIEKDETSLKLLGYTDDEIHGDKRIRLRAHGTATGDRWTRNRPVQASKFIGDDVS
ncbi:unnamed protein product [Ambrosiozyma monospora]|uniref:Mitochondrial import inner membrane translocase subunit Tim21 n=1 Tax=Ambrosiozyma monospora TaxID=43982 RepID=A0A9W6T2S9_AMBMO|nr:unnamed protein product [Ambrosiozyma monospora]